MQQRERKREKNRVKFQHFLKKPQLVSLNRKNAAAIAAKQIKGLILRPIA